MGTKHSNQYVVRPQNGTGVLKGFENDPAAPPPYALGRIALVSIGTDPTIALRSSFVFDLEGDVHDYRTHSSTLTTYPIYCCIVPIVSRDVVRCTPVNP